MNNHEIGNSDFFSLQNNKNVEMSLEKIDEILSKLNQQKNSLLIFKSNNYIF